MPLYFPMSTSALWLIAYFWPLVALLVFAVAPRLFQRVRQNGARLQRRANVVVSAQRRSTQSGAFAANTLTLQVRSKNGAGAVVTLDGRMSGAALLQRAQACLGQDLKGLKLPGGDSLAIDQTLLAQGLEGGEVLETYGGEQQTMPAILQRAREEISQFKFSLHFNEANPCMSRFHLTIDIGHAPQAIAEASMETVRVQFQEDSISLTIRGPTKDFMLHRRLSQSTHNKGVLPVGFPICPTRCNLVVLDGKQVELVLRPFPEDWLPTGTRICIHGLKQDASNKLNGRAGTVIGYEESTKQAPERYIVQLDGAASDVKKLKRCNVEHLQLPHSADIAAGGTPESLGKAEGTGLSCPDARDDGPAWSRARRQSGVEAERLRLLEQLH
mmetsp:Transcript_13908/g.27475  ORF Transcript_13908/g.27475 Transcript_13908/m.27475 type:complete len:385 (+) Transcript_13908:28-1182(+)